MGGAASTRLGAPAAALSMSGDGSQDPPSPRAGRRGLPSPRRRLEKDTGLPGQLQQSAACQTKKTLFNVQVNY